MPYSDTYLHVAAAEEPGSHAQEGGVEVER